jgi:hypothetical protein
VSRTRPSLAKAPKPNRIPPPPGPRTPTSARGWRKSGAPAGRPSTSRAARAPRGRWGGAVWAAGALPPPADLLACRRGAEGTGEPTLVCWNARQPPPTRARRTLPEQINGKSANLNNCLTKVIYPNLAARPQVRRLPVSDPRERRLWRRANPGTGSVISNPDTQHNKNPARTSPPARCWSCLTPTCKPSAASSARWGLGGKGGCSPPSALEGL